MKEANGKAKIKWIILVILMVSLIASNPDADDFKDWYIEKYGLSGALVSIAVKREDRFLFSIFKIKVTGFSEEKNLAMGFAGQLIDLDE